MTLPLAAFSSEPGHDSLHGDGLRGVLEARGWYRKLGVGTALDLSPTHTSNHHLLLLLLLLLLPPPPRTLTGGRVGTNTTGRT